MRKATQQPLALGWVADLPKFAAGPQLAALLSHGLAERDIVVNGSKRESGKRRNWAWLMQRARSGDAIGVAKLRAIYAPHGKLTPRKALFRRLHEIEDHGCTIVEISTNRRSEIARDRDMMIIDALDEIARASKGGRKSNEFTAAERELVERHWRSFEHQTNRVAVDVILAEARGLEYINLLRLRSVQAFINTFGGSGRDRIKRRKTDKS